jgi:apolipoprotein N-acyltransferase
MELCRFGAPSPFAYTQTADLGGPVLVGLVLLAINVAVTEALFAWREKRAPHRITMVASVALPVLACVYGYLRLRQIDARVAGADKAVVGLVQGNMGLLEKREEGKSAIPGVEEGLRRHFELSRQLKNEGADLIVWSESSATRPAREETAFRELKQRVGVHIGVPTIFGAVLVKFEDDLVKLYNVALATTKEGDVTSRYDKQYLLMFGEYLPLGEVFPVLYKWSPHTGKFRPGNSLEPLITEIKGVKRRITALICYEDILPGFTNDAVRHANPELIVNLTNDAWFGDTAEPWEHLALAKLRAIEHRRYLARSTNSGVSAIIDPVGRVVIQTKTFQQATAKAQIAFLSESTVYEVVGDKIWYLIAFGALVLAFVGKNPQKQVLATSAAPGIAP